MKTKDFLYVIWMLALVASNCILFEQNKVLNNDLIDIDQRLTALEQNARLEIPKPTAKTIKDVRITYYEPVVEQCWGDPLVTASGYKIDTVALRQGKVKVCAVSRDLEKVFPMGSKIEVFIKDGHRWNGVYTVQDRTSARLSNTIDILSNTDKGGCYKGNITCKL